jgi:hypothetical protein
MFFETMDAGLAKTRAVYKKRIGKGEKTADGTVRTGMVKKELSIYNSEAHQPTEQEMVAEAIANRWG